MAKINQIVNKVTKEKRKEDTEKGDLNIVVALELRVNKLNMILAMILDLDVRESFMDALPKKKANRSLQSHLVK